MQECFGIILLDRNEIIVRVYGGAQGHTWKLLYKQTYDLETFTSEKYASASQIIEVIAQVSLSKYAMHVTNWDVCARNIPDSTIHDIAQATGAKIETLTLDREQDLLCKGVLTERY